VSYLLDSNAVIALIEGRPAIHARARYRPTNELIISTIVMHELYFGAYRGNRTNKTLDILDQLQFEILDFTDDDARRAGEVRALLAERGASIGPYDVLIAGQALARGLTLVTRNLREFQRVDGLAVEDWEGPA
jgi:tRNA(fMet)-specific endonuclease VapC